MTESDASEGGISRWTNDIHQGDAGETLAEMPESSVHCVVTSPPYYGQRDYGDETITVWGADQDCDHDWVSSEVYQDSPIRSSGDPMSEETTESDERWRTTGRCSDCGARREQLGLEEHLGDYVDDLVQIGEEIRRVLRPDGNWWLNLGDSFASQPGWGSQSEEVGGHDAEAGSRERTFERKQKMLVPHRVAIALQESGWIVRGDPVWAKNNPMPGPWEDRLNETKEFIFHLTPQPTYFFDLDSIREPHKEQSIERATRKENRHEHNERQSVHHEETLNPEQFCHPEGKNPGDIFEVSTVSFPEAHFAVYPPELVKAPVKASCPPVVCSDCGTPYKRESEVVEREEAGGVSKVPADERGYDDRQGSSQNDRDRLTQPTERCIGPWEQNCDCESDATEPGIVLDPFSGAGTTALVAKRLGRRFIAIDLNPDYVAMSQHRVGLTVDEPERLDLVEDDSQAVLVQADGGCNDRSVGTGTDQEGSR